MICEWCLTTTSSHKKDFISLSSRLGNIVYVCGISFTYIPFYKARFDYLIYVYIRSNCCIDKLYHNANRPGPKGGQ